MLNSIRILNLAQFLLWRDKRLIVDLATHFQRIHLNLLIIIQGKIHLVLLTLRCLADLLRLWILRFQDIELGYFVWTTVEGTLFGIMHSLHINALRFLSVLLWLKLWCRREPIARATWSFKLMMCHALAMYLVCDIVLVLRSRNTYPSIIALTASSIRMLLSL